MESRKIEMERIQRLNERDIVGGEYVLYWMQQSQRAHYNHALDLAVEQANTLGLPCVVAFGLMPDYPEANARHYAFMLEGLEETWDTLTARGIPWIARHGIPPRVALELGGRASLIVCDRGYLRHQVAWRQEVAREAPCRVVQVESDVVVPVETVSDKAEYAARTLRPKLRRHLEAYLRELTPAPLLRESLNLPLGGMDRAELRAVSTRLQQGPDVAPVGSRFRGGARAAEDRLRELLQDKLSRYADHRNQPQTDDVSYMGMYLHFGQISPLYLALRVMGATHQPAKDREAFLEELLVRRELAMNFVHYRPDYDSYTCLPAWAKATLADHESDPRSPLYTPQQLESGQTHDIYWNAAMNEMKACGYMHNSMRMYWGKKILEWSRTPEEAFQTVLALNNKYFLDGRDPCSYANVAWVFGLHDRPWKERPVYGKVRCMMASGLERKCDIRAYVRKVQELVQQAGM
jgi:deoxyribodipyrimidine photo-lyase